MPPKKVLYLFVATLLNAAFVVLFLFILSSDSQIWGMPQLMFVSWFLSFVLGIALVYTTHKSKTKGNLRKFLLLMGYSTVGFPLFVVGHNMFYAFAILSEDITVLRVIFEFLEVVSFLIAIPGCPIGFLVGATGSGVMMVKKSSKR